MATMLFVIMTSCVTYCIALQPQIITYPHHRSDHFIRTRRQLEASDSSGVIRNSNEKNVDLTSEADLVFPIISSVHELWERKEISSADLVGAFIIIVCAFRRPKAWLSGKLSQPVLNSEDFKLCPESMRLSAVPSLLEVAGGLAYLSKKLGGVEDISIHRVFNECAFSGIKKNTDEYINRCMSFWFAGKRPFVLLFRIPSPMEVLRQQAAGERVVTLFMTREQLGRRHEAALVYMEGDQRHSKDPLEFLLHDLKHMENFVDPSTHYEQVGFFRCLLKLGVRGTSRSSLKAFFRDECGLDIRFWNELEYVISKI